MKRSYLREIYDGVSALRRQIVSDLSQFSKQKLVSQRSDSNTDFIVIWEKGLRSRKITHARDIVGISSKGAPASGNPATMTPVRFYLRNKLKSVGIDVFDVSDESAMESVDAIWLLSAPFEVLYRTAEAIELNKACMGQHGRKGFYVISAKTHRIFCQCPAFGTRFFFTSAERQRLIWHLIGSVKHNLRAILPQLRYHGILACIPLHATSFRNSFLWEHLWNPGSQHSLDKAAEYYGAELGFYFAWLAHYTKWMTFPALVGICLYFQDRDYIGMSPYAVMYAVLLCVWMSLYLVMWTRYCNLLRVRWGVMDFDDREILAEPREGFTGKRRISPITGKEEIHSRGSKRFAKMYLVSLPVTASCLYICFWALTVSIAMQDYCQEVYICRETPLSRFPSILYSCTIPVLGHLYRYVAQTLTEWENHKTHSQYRDSLIIKLTCFHFINNYLSLFYIFFWLRDLPRLKQYLQTLMILTQLISTTAEIGLPYLSAKYALYKANVAKLQQTSVRKKTDEEPSPTAGTTDDGGVEKRAEKDDGYASGLRKRRGTKMDNDRAQSHPFSSPPPVKSKSFRRSSSKGVAFVSSPSYSLGRLQRDLNDAIFAADIKLETYDGLLGEYFTVLRDHGFVIMFGWCWGLAPLCALLSNMLQLRFDMWKICTSFRRPLHRDADGIGAWDVVLKVYAVLFISIVFAMLATYELVVSAGKEGAEPFCYSIGIWAERVISNFENWPYTRFVFEKLSFLDETTSELKLLVVVVLEHAVFACLFVFYYAIPNIPGHVRQSMQRRKYVEHELVKQQLKLSSARKHRNRSFYHAKRRSMHVDRVARYG